VTGQEHRDYTETLLEMASGADPVMDREHCLLSKAQVHATMAVAAAIEAQNELIISAVRELAKLAPSLLAALAKGGGAGC